MGKLKTIDYVSSEISENVCAKLMEELHIRLVQTDSVQSVFARLTRPDMHSDFVAICIDELNKSAGGDAYDVLKKLDELRQDWKKIG